MASDGGAAIRNAFPLVVLDNLDNQDTNFGYYSYNFIANGEAPISDVNLDQSPGALFTRIGADNLRLFGTLPNPANLQDPQGKTPTLVPGDYTYQSVEDFDMRNDAANYASFHDSDPGNFYTRYYFGDKLNINSNGGTGSFPAGWEASKNLYPYSPVISLEFDSRSLGWYWQPVLNATDQSINFDTSKLWIKNGTTGTWTSYSFSDLSNRVEAYRYSLMAATFYYLDGGNADQKQELIDKASLYRQLHGLEQIMPDLKQLDQSVIRDISKQLILLQQITKVEESDAPDLGNVGNAYKVTFNSVNAQGSSFSTDLTIFRNTLGQLKAVPSNAQERELELKIQRLSNLIGSDCGRLGVSDSWPGSGTPDVAPRLHALNQVRDIVFDAYGTGQHRVVYANNVGKRADDTIHQIRIIKSATSNDWIAYYKGKLPAQPASIQASPVNRTAHSETLFAASAMRTADTPLTGGDQRLAAAATLEPLSDWSSLDACGCPAGTDPRGLLQQEDCSLERLADSDLITHFQPDSIEGASDPHSPCWNDTSDAGLLPGQDWTPFLGGGPMTSNSMVGLVASGGDCSVCLGLGRDLAQKPGVLTLDSFQDGGMLAF